MTDRRDGQEGRGARPVTGTAMGRIGRIVFFTAFVVVIGAAAWAQFVTQRTRANTASATNASVAMVFDAVVQSENAARDSTVVRDQATLDAYTASREQLATVITDARAALHGGALRAQLDHELALVDSWTASVDQDVAAAGSGASATDAERAAARGAQLTAIRAANDSLLRALDRHDREERDDAGMRGLLIVIGCCVFFAALNWGLFLRSERREHAIRDRQMAFADRLPTARSEPAARTMLARHLEVVAPGAMVLVTGPDDASPIGRPVMSGGARVATVIIRADHDLSAPVERLVHDSILRAGPVLGTLQLLAHEQERAATDPLTGLGNRRLVEDALERLVAQARRTGGRFAVAVIDLDQFKPVNDTHGHAAGDALLVAVAGVLDDADPRVRHRGSTRRRRVHRAALGARWRRGAHGDGTVPRRHRRAAGGHASARCDRQHRGHAVRAGSRRRCRRDPARRRRRGLRRQGPGWQLRGGRQDDRQRPAVQASAFRA